MPAPPPPPAPDPEPPPPEPAAPAPVPPSAGAPAPGATPGYFLQKVFFATDRKINERREFTAEPNHALTFGEIFVTIPASHQEGVIETPSIFKLEFRRDRNKHFTLLATLPLNQAAFLARVNQSMQGARKQAFVFVHGYNVTFESAAMRTAQIAFDMKFNGAPIFYSWPSAGKLLSYFRDAQASERSTSHLQQFLLSVVEQTEAEDVFLIGHSMGSRPLTKALAELGKLNKGLDAKVRELVLAAPDIDPVIFTTQIAPFLRPSVSNITLYTSDRDKALLASELIQSDEPRLGQASYRPFLTDAETIDATRVDTDFLGHSYFAQSPLLIQDITVLLKDRLRAARRKALMEFNTTNPVTWQFRPVQ